MQVKFKLLKGSHAGKECKLPAPKCLIGRNDDCHLKPQSEEVSRRHCVILTTESEVTIRDLNSRKGTFVNGEKITGDTVLLNGDVVKVGPLEFEMLIEHTAARIKKPKVSDINVTAWLDEADAKSRYDVEKAASDTADLLELIQPPAEQPPCENTRARLIVNASDDLEEVVKQIRSKLRSSQLVFCALPLEHDVNGLLEDRGLASPAFKALASDYSGMLVLNAHSGLQADGSYDMEAFYRNTFQSIKQQLQLDISDTHHEQEIVQILRDISQLFLCVLHLDCVPLELIPRVRCLLQEGHSSLVCYSPVRTAKSSAPQESQWENGMLDKLSPQPEASRESRPDKKPPGKLPPREVSQAKVSREAASDMLKKLFNRR